MNAELEEISRGDDGASKSALWRGNASRLMKDQDQHAVHGRKLRLAVQKPSS